jgi:hypothetical protein
VVRLLKIELVRSLTIPVAIISFQFRKVSAEVSNLPKKVGNDVNVQYFLDI